MLYVTFNYTKSIFIFPIIKNHTAFFPMFFNDSCLLKLSVNICDSDLSD